MSYIPRFSQLSQQGTASTTRRTTLIAPNRTEAGDSSSSTLTSTPRTGSTQDTTTATTTTHTSDTSAKPVPNPPSGLHAALADRPHGQHSIYALQRPTPSRPRCRLYITRTSFMNKGVETAPRWRSLGNQCPICLLMFEYTEENAAKRMVTVRRCGCHFHRECLEQCREQWCPCCRLKWWRRSFGTWFADFTRPEEILAAGRPGRAFTAPRRV